jgi:pyrroline-5-carboxylate reductase
MKITFIGGGNMATALISSLYTSGHSIHTIRVVDPNPEARSRLEARWPVSGYESATEALADMEAIVLAVKPQVLPFVLDEIGGQISADQLVISIVAGVGVQRIAAYMDANPSIVRCMSNTPALIGLGMTGLFAQRSCSPEQREIAQKVMQSAGEVVWLEEERLLDVVTAVSGSGPAYFFYLIEALRSGGEKLGLPPDVAAKLALQTAHGSGAMAAQSRLDVADLRRQVTTPGGTTEAALQVLQTGNFTELLERAVEAATRRGQELGKGAQ